MSQMIATPFNAGLGAVNSRGPTVKSDYVSLHRLIVALLLFESLAIWMHFLRVTTSAEQSALVAKGVMALVLLGAAFIVVRRGLQLHMFNVIFLLMLGQGLLIGSANTEHYLTKPWVSHIIYWTIMAISFNAGAMVKIDWKQLARTLARYAKVSVYATAIGLLAIEVYRLTSGAGLYAGYQGSQLLLPLGVAFARRDRKLLIVTFIVLILVSRRGPLAAGTVALATVWTVRHARGVYTGLAMSLVPMALSALLLSIAVSYVLASGAYAESSTVHRVSVKWQRLFDFEEDATSATSGRDKEVLAVLDLFDGGPKEWISGQGFGWFVFPFRRSRVPVQFIHFSYLNFIATHGVVLGGLLLVCVLREVFACLALAVHGTHHQEVAWMVSFMLLAIAIVSVTVAMLQVSILFWILLGAAYQANRTLPMRRIATQ